MTEYLRSWALDDIVIRSGGDGRTVEAYAAMFDQPYEVRDQHGHYMEVIERSAFNRTLKNGGADRVVCLYNHGMSLHGTPDALASVPLGRPLEIRADARGLWTVTRYNRSELADATLEAIRAGDIRSQSFRGRIFRSTGQPRARRSGGELPTVVRHELGLADYGPTPIPVNSSAKILAVRSAVDVLDALDDLDDDERDALLDELARHYPGRHRQASHGNRYGRDADGKRGALIREGKSKLDRDDDDQGDDDAPAGKAAAIMGGLADALAAHPGGRRKLGSTTPAESAAAMAESLRKGKGDPHSMADTLDAMAGLSARGNKNDATDLIKAAAENLRKLPAAKRTPDAPAAPRASDARRLSDDAHDGLTRVGEAAAAMAREGKYSITGSDELGIPRPVVSQLARRGYIRQNGIGPGAHIALTDKGHAYLMDQHGLADLDAKLVRERDLALAEADKFNAEKTAVGDSPYKSRHRRLLGELERDAQGRAQLMDREREKLRDGRPESAEEAEAFADKAAADRAARETAEREEDERREAEKADKAAAYAQWDELRTRHKAELTASLVDSRKAGNDAARQARKAHGLPSVTETRQLVKSTNVDERLRGRAAEAVTDAARQVAAAQAVYDNNQRQIEMADRMLAEEGLHPRNVDRLKFSRDDIAKVQPGNLDTLKSEQRALSEALTRWAEVNGGGKPAAPSAAASPEATASTRDTTGRILSQPVVVKGIQRPAGWLDAAELSVVKNREGWAVQAPGHNAYLRQAKTKAEADAFVAEAAASRRDQYAAERQPPPAPIDPATVPGTAAYKAAKLKEQDALFARLNAGREKAEDLAAAEVDEVLAKAGDVDLKSPADARALAERLGLRVNVVPDGKGRFDASFFRGDERLANFYQTGGRTGWSDRTGAVIADRDRLALALSDFAREKDRDYHGRQYEIGELAKKAQASRERRGAPALAPLQRPEPSPEFAPAAPLPRREDNKAKRGDLLIAEKVTRIATANGRGQEIVTYEVYEVTSATRDGQPKRVRDLKYQRDYDMAIGNHNRRDFYGRRHVIPGDQVDMAAVQAALAAHTYPGTTTPRAYGSKKALDAAIRPHVKEKPTAKPTKSAKRSRPIQGDLLARITATSAHADPGAEDSQPVGLHSGRLAIRRALVRAEMTKRGLR